MRTLEKVEVRKSEKVAVAPLLLTPTSILKMVEGRQKFQVMKFRTTCADCLPNY